MNSESKSTPDTPRTLVNLKFVGWVLASLLITAVGLVLIVVWIEHSTQNVPGVVSSVLSPLVAIVGTLLGHHVGSRTGHRSSD
jgi:hypothetical protein